MEFVINLDAKGAAYRSAFNRYYDRMKDIGFFFELGNPKIDGNPDWFSRLHQINDDRICAYAVDINFAGEYVTVIVKPFGPYKDNFNELATQNKVAISSRMITTKNRLNIVGLDMVHKENHVDQNYIIEMTS